MKKKTTKNKEQEKEEPETLWELTRRSREPKRILIKEILKMQEKLDEERDRIREEVKAEINILYQKLKEIGEFEINSTRSIELISRGEEIEITHCHKQGRIIDQELPKETQMKLKVNIRTKINEELKPIQMTITKENGTPIHLFHSNTKNTCLGTMTLPEKIETKEKLRELVNEYKQMMKTINLDSMYTVSEEINATKNYIMMINGYLNTTEDTKRETRMKSLKENIYLKNKQEVKNIINEIETYKYDALQAFRQLMREKGEEKTEV